MTEKVKALVLTGYGINCDIETQYALNRAGAEAERIHINRLIEMSREGRGLKGFHILAVPGGFSWGDDHGAGVLLGLKMRVHLGREIDEFLARGGLVFGICNGFQALVNMGLLPGFAGDYRTRSVALTANDRGNFRNDWIHLMVNPGNRCVFTEGLTHLDLPVRHGEGKFYAPPEVLARLEANGQVVLRYARPAGPDVTPAGSDLAPGEPGLIPAGGEFPYNPNGSLNDIAGICDETGRVFGLMPHPEAFHHLTNHPAWTRLIDEKKRHGRAWDNWTGDGLMIFRKAVEYIQGM